MNRKKFIDELAKVLICGRLFDCEGQKVCFSKGYISCVYSTGHNIQFNVVKEETGFTVIAVDGDFPIGDRLFKFGSNIFENVNALMEVVDSYITMDSESDWYDCYNEDYEDCDYYGSEY